MLTIWCIAMDRWRSGALYLVKLSLMNLLKIVYCDRIGIVNIV